MLPPIRYTLIDIQHLKDRSYYLLYSNMFSNELIVLVSNNTNGILFFLVGCYFLQNVSHGNKLDIHLNTRTIVFNYTPDSKQAQLFFISFICACPVHEMFFFCFIAIVSWIIVLSISLHFCVS